MLSSQNWIAIGCVSALVSVVAGAFGAHALAERLTPRMLEVFRTGAQYQMYHALALVAFGLWVGQAGAPASQLAGWLFLAGTVIFSGTLYVLALSGITWLGAITPLGGLCFIIGWAAFAWGVVKP